MKFKKLMVFAATIALTLVMTSVVAFGATESLAGGLAGSGSETDPYMINSLEDLIFFRDSVNKGETTYNADGKYVALGADIDMSSVDWSENIGDDFDAVFIGIFDGKGHTIKNLTSIETETGSNYYICSGLFGIIYGDACIKNLTIENVNIATAYSGNCVGAVAGFVYSNTGSIENVIVTGNIVINAPEVASVGVIAGYVYYSECTIKNCFVYGGNTSFINAKSQAGGILGYGSDGTELAIENCTTQNLAISGTGLIGGSVGILSGGSVKGATVENVALTVTGENWQNSAAVVLGTTAKDKTVVTYNKFNNVKVNGKDTNVIVGSQYEYKPTEVVPAIQAAIGGTYYYTLADAIADAKSGDTIKINANCDLTEGIVIPEGKVITLDLNGFTISQKKEQTEGYQMILNHGKLTIDDSSTNKTGKLSYIDSGNGGEYISDTIYNCGVLVINGGTIENLSSATVASNGYPHAVDTYSGIRNTSVTINGGTIYCAEYSAIRMFCTSATNTADLIINKGVVIKGAIDMQNGTKNAAKGTLTINGGKFEITKNSNNIRFANWNGGATEYGIVAKITDGTFDGGITTAYVPGAANWNKKIISGGNFASDKFANDEGLIDFLVTGKKVTFNTTTGYYVVEDMQLVDNNTTTTVVAGDSKVTVDGEVDKPLAEGSVGAAVSSNNTAVKNSEVIAAAAKAVEVKNEDVVSALEGETLTEGADVIIEVKPYLDVKVTEVDSATKTIVLDIEPMCDVYAKVGEGGEGKKVNDEPVKLEVEADKDNPVVITVPLTAGFAAPGSKIYIVHTKGNGTTYVYEAIVSADGLTATFENPNGFSKFAIILENPVASIAGTPYASLADAIAAATNGSVTVIELLDKVELTGEFEINKDVTINGNGNTITGGSLFITGDVTLNNIVFEECTHPGSRFGIVEFYNSESTVVGCTFRKNIVGSIIAIDTSGPKGYGTSKVVIEKCKFEDNECDVAVVYGYDGKALTVKKCDFTNNKSDISVIYVADDATVTGCYFEGNEVVNSTILVGPYDGSADGETSYTVNINGNALLDINEGVPSVLIEDWTDAYGSSNTTDIGNNYWVDGDAPVEGKDYSTKNRPVVKNTDSYFNTYERNENGGIVSGDYIEPETPSDTPSRPDRGESAKLNYDATVKPEPIVPPTVTNPVGELVLTIGSTSVDVFGNVVTNDVAPEIVNGYTMLPGRLVVESLGGFIGWDAAEQRVRVIKGTTTIDFFIGQKFALVNGMPVEINVAPYIKDGRTFIEVRSLVENLGAEIQWNAETRQVTIISK